ncbi:Mce-associated membrane protein [Kitasatospora gansuensis]|uniref:Mce-associated membrane protein n=1 Tax=Kitasatospora gansuensis TaxID=258050 RepID=A0A7W7SHU4_9ACTN|nr:hypothetical protein [Kitasatospora gansuensis]MBB4950642.1 Mce-associated membrane protein [Kitasatospora gansuensis]
MALSVLAFGGLSHWQARSETAGERARSGALAAGRTAVAVLTSADAADPAATRARWLSVTHAPLRDRLAAAPAADLTVRATVAGAALTALDPAAGTARLIAVVRLELVATTGALSTDRRRVTVALTRTGDGWKAADLATVPVEAV